MSKVLIATSKGNIYHKGIESVQADREAYKQRIQAVIENVGLVPARRDGVRKALIDEVKSELKKANSGVRIVLSEETGWELQSQANFSISIDWSTGEWEIAGFD